MTTTPTLAKKKDKSRQTGLRTPENANTHNSYSAYEKRFETSEQVTPNAVYS